MTRQEFIRRKRAYLRKYPAPKPPREGCMVLCGREYSLDVVKFSAELVMDEYDNLPRSVRDEIKERGYDKYGCMDIDVTETV